MRLKTPYFLLYFLFGVAGFAAIGEAAADDRVPTAFADSIPAAWTYDTQKLQIFPTDDSWWKQFDDPMLDSLIAEGEAANFNLAAAKRRIEIARQNLRSVRSAYFPQLSLSAGWTKSRTSGALTDESVSSTVDYFNAGVDMSWQIDLFGKVTARARESKAAVEASRAEYAAMSITVCAEIAQAYIELRTLQQQLAMTQAHIVEQERVLKIAEARFEASLASMLDVSQARTVYYSTRASIISLQTSIVTTINSLAVLVGEYPQNLEPRLAAAAPQPAFDAPIGTGVPMELLRRRPDLVEAEFSLAENAAALGVAKKEFLPTLTLSGSIGTQAHRFDELMTHRSFTYSIVPTLSWTIFDGFARSAAIASAKQDMLAGIDNYNMTLLTAVQEAENAMVTYYDTGRYLDEMEQVVDNARKAFDLSLDRYKQGLDAFINVAQAQISLLQYSNELVAARGQRLTAAVALYKALGGGWDMSTFKK